MDNKDRHIDEDLLARRLADAHDQLLHGDDQNCTPDPEDSPLHGPKKILGLIAAVRERQHFVDTPGLDATVADEDHGQDLAAFVQSKAETNIQFDTSRLGRFQVQERLGQGGFAIVFKGYDPDLDRTVALKVPRPETLFTDDLRARFLREAKTAAALSHPHIVTIYETGVHQNVCFLVCEYIEGETLADWNSRHNSPVEPRAAANLISTLADALQHAHSRGVFHRDIKPGNILLKFEASADDQRVQLDASQLAQAACIADFGLAKFDTDNVHETRTGSVIGTPAYMAPEQANAQHQEITHCADIYSLGTVMYELLAGRRPFETEAMLDLLQAVQNKEPPPPSKFAPEIPADLEAICLKCLEKNPQSRYASARQLADDLGRFLNDQPVVARPVTNLNRWVRWTRRNPALATASALALLFLVAGFAFTSWQWVRAETNLAEANENHERAERHIERVEWVVDRMLTDVAMVLARVPEMDSLRKRVMQQAMAIQEELTQEESHDPGIKVRAARAFRLVAQIQYDLGETDEALKTSIRTRELLEDIPAEFANDVAQERGMLDHIQTNIFLGQQDLDAAESLLKKSIKNLGDEMSGSDDNLEQLLLLATSLRMVGVVQEKKGQLSEAKASFEAAETIVNRVPVDDKLGMEYRTIQYRTLNSSALLARRQGRLEDAARQYQQSMEICSHLIDDFPQRIDFSFDFAQTAMNYANYLFRVPDYEQAARYYELSADTVSELSQRHPGVVRYRVHRVSTAVGLGSTYRRLRRPADAIAAAQKGIEEAKDLEQKFGANPSLNSSSGMLFGNLALVLSDTGRVDEAVAAHEQAIAMAQRMLDSYPEINKYRLQYSRRKSNLGRFLFHQGRAAEAESVMLESYKVATDCLNREPNNPAVQRNVIFNLASLSAVCCQLENHDEALEFAAAITEVGPEQSSNQIQAVKCIADCVEQMQQDNVPGAIVDRYVDRAIEWLQRARQLGFKDSKQLESSVEPLLRYELFRVLVSQD